MVTTRNIVFLLTALALVAGSMLLLLPGKEKQVRRQLTRLTEYAAKQPAEPTLTTVTKVARIGSLFATTCSLRLEHPPVDGSYSRKEVMDRINRARAFFSRLQVSFYDIRIRFPEELRAELLLTIRLVGTIDDESYDDAREVELTMEKADKKWLISRVRQVEVLER